MLAQSWTDAHLAMAAMDGRPNCDPKGRCDVKEDISRRWIILDIIRILLDIRR